MSELPRHPESDHDRRMEAGREGGGPSWKTYALVAAGIALVLVMVILHLAGVVGPGSN